jgi:putative FmdB family regulatory protein
MPLYEYKCEKCGKHFDALQKFSDQPLAVHDDCGGVLERLVSPPAFHFKGTGWYVTDYAKSNGVSTPASESSSTSKDEAPKKSDSKSESKSESKSDSKSDSKSESKSQSSTPATPAPAPSTSDKK